MTQLSNLQHQFQTRILGDSQDGAPDWVSNSGRAAPALQFFVYSNAYRLRLREALAEDYAAVNLAIGDDAFFELVDTYIEHFPSRYFSLRDFGEHFPGFLSQHPAQQEQPWLPELAAFEWELRSAFDASDAPRLTEADLAGVAPETWPALRFAPNPSLRFSRVNWNIPVIWNCLKSEPPQEVIAEPTPAVWLIWRDTDLVTRFRSLEPDEEHALACLCTGGDFDEVCVVLSGFHNEEQVPLRAAGLLKSWIAQGLLSELQH